MSVEFSIEVKTHERHGWGDYGFEPTEKRARAAIATLKRKFAHVRKWRFRIVKVTREVVS